MPRFTQILKTLRTIGANIVAEFVGGLMLNGACQSPLVTLAWATPLTPDFSLGSMFVTTATSNIAYTVAAPTNPPSDAGQSAILTLTIRNGSGGALGAATFNAVYKLGAAWTNPANGFSRSIQFRWDGTNWVEISRTAADVAN